MRFLFVFGVGRSGTTLLGRLLAYTQTPARFVTELCPSIPDRIPNPIFMVEPADAATIGRVRDALFELAAGKLRFAPDQAWRLERDDADAQVAVVKDVHSLLAWPAIVEGLPAWRAVVITRETPRVLDSLLRERGNRRYLAEDYAWLARHLDADPRDPRIDRAASSLPARMTEYLRRPRLLTRGWLRQALAAELLARFLRDWALHDARVAHVEFEALCRDPLGETLRLYEFLELDHDDETLDRIRRTTTGSSDEYYATDKDSRRVLGQGYKMLSRRRQRRLARFLGGS
ncbi:MAG TPA: hypothetical protein VMW19_20090 [Myxococcota bacterium]|nr:hypothetical protein [Myxococcota bacterium]